MKFELENFHRNVSENDLLDDLRNTYAALSKNGIPLTFRSYNETGKYSVAPILARFGSWNEGLRQAGLEVNAEKNISDKDLFVNIEKIWASLGRQPKLRDLVKPFSKYTQSAYFEHFGGWRNSLEAFVKYINEDEEAEESHSEIEEYSELTKAVKKRRTSRNISDRMRFRILSRDGFTCQSCGASPIKERGVELHVDHIIPWSKDGETVEGNLQTKCSQCNLGKGNAFDK